MKAKGDAQNVTPSLSSSVISDYLPSAVLDELELSNPKPVFSSNLPNFFKDDQNESTQYSTTGSLGSFHHQKNNNIKKNFSEGVPYVNRKMIRQQTNPFYGNSIRPTPRSVYSDNLKKLFPLQHASSNLNSLGVTNIHQSQKSLYPQFPLMIPPQKQQIQQSLPQSPLQQQGPFFQNFQMQQFQQKNSVNIFENQLESLNGIMSLKMIIETFPPDVILAMIKSSKGSRHLQKIICASPPNQTETDRLVTIIAPVATEMMCDYYGNYFLQKFIPYFSLKHRLTFYQFIQPNFLQIANNICGNHSLQSLIALQNSKEEEMIIKSAIENYIPTMAFGANSSHVIAKIINSVKECNRSYINCYVINNLISLSLDSNGICIVKAFIAGLEHESYIGSVIFQFSNEVTKLTYDQYGNFGIQEIINRFGSQYARNIIYHIVEHLISFSVSKFSSNVVDCIIQYFSKNSPQNFTKIVLKIFVEENNLNEMLKNKYATYVIENCLNLLFEKKSFEFNELKVKIFKLLINKPAINDKKQIMEILKNFIVNHTD